jgi:hypothetical protein
LLQQNFSVGAGFFWLAETNVVKEAMGVQQMTDVNGSNSC